LLRKIFLLELFLCWLINSVMPAAFGVFCIILLRYLKALQGIIDSPNQGINQDRGLLNEVQQKLKNLRNSLIQFFLGRAFSFYAVITYFVIGSVPFFWAYGMAVLLFFPISLSLQVLSFIGNSQVTSTNSSSKENNDSPTSKYILQSREAASSTEKRLNAWL